MELILLFGSLLLLVALGVPVAFSIGIASLVTLLVADLDVPLELLPRQMFTGMDSFALMAIPFFILGGELMNEAGLTTRIIQFADAVIGHMKGSLAQVNILSNLMMAGVSGSGAADAAATSTVMLPQMQKAGYDRDFAVSLTACAATVGPIIPPSVLFILYGFLTNVSIGDLFIGGLIPGLVMGMSLMAVTAVLCRKRNYQQSPRPFELQRVVKTGPAGLAALIAPAVIAGSILTGFATATEAGVVVVALAVAYGLFLFRTLHSMSAIIRVVESSIHTTAMVFMIIATSALFSNILTRLRFQQLLLDGLSAISDERWPMLLMMVMVILVLGLVIDVTPLLVMFAIPFSQVAAALGFDPVFFGVVMVIAAMIGSVTPPVGGVLMICAGIGRVPVTATLRVLPPFVAALIAALLLVLLVPATATFLPSLFDK